MANSFIYNWFFNLKQYLEMLLFKLCFLSWRIKGNVSQHLLVGQFSTLMRGKVLVYKMFVVNLAASRPGWEDPPRMRKVDRLLVLTHAKFTTHISFKGFNVSNWHHIGLVSSFLHLLNRDMLPMPAPVTAVGGSCVQAWSTSSLVTHSIYTTAPTHPIANGQDYKVDFFNKKFMISLYLLDYLMINWSA